MKFYFRRYFNAGANDGGGGKTAEDQLIEKIRGMFTAEFQTRGIQDKAALDALITQSIKQNVPETVAKTEVEAIRADLLKTAGDLQKLKDEGLQSSSDKPKSLRAQIKEWQTRNKEAIASIKEGKRPELPELQVRAAITMTVGASLGSDGRLVSAFTESGLVDLNRVQPTFWDYIPKGRTNAAAYIWVNKVNKQGNAAFIGEGVLKPLASFELDTEISNAKKVAERMKASMEILEDVDGMATFIRDELEYEVKMAVNTALLTGTNSSTVPAGITTLATAYTLTTVKTASPNNYDAIRAAAAQLATLRFTNNIVAFVNPVDAANMDIAKASTSGVYILPPFTTTDGRRIGNVTVVEDGNIAVGSLLIADLSKYRILIYKDFTVSWGWENDDFSKNLVTALGEMRLHQFVSANNTGAFIYDTFANIKTAITAA
jgi:hypothetical protein